MWRLIEFIKLKVGAQRRQAEEPFSRPIFQIEFDAPEPKALLPKQLIELVKLYKSYVQTAEVIGASEGFL